LKKGDKGGFLGFVKILELFLPMGKQLQDSVSLALLPEKYRNFRLFSRMIVGNFIRLVKMKPGLKTLEECLFLLIYLNNIIMIE